MAETKAPHRYREVGLLAEGGMALVARGLDEAGHDVVIKRIRPPLCFDQSYLRLFVDEGRVHGALDHPNILRLLDRGEDEAGPFLVFEHVDGTDLGVLLDSAIAQGVALDLAGVVSVFSSLFAALQAAHQACGADGAGLCVVHRDVSPGNVLIGSDGCVKLADFGVAASTLKSERTVAGEMKGKFAYMAPEQTRGEEVDARADLFSAGVVLWECLANRRLFDGPTDADVVQAVRRQPTPAIESLRSDVPAALAALCAALTAKSPADRPGSAGAARDAIAAAALELGIDDGLSRHAARLARTAPSRTLRPIAPDVRRRTQRVVGPPGALQVTSTPRRFRAGAAAGVVLLALATGAWWSRTSSEQVTQLPPSPPPTPPVPLATSPTPTPTPPIDRPTPGAVEPGPPTAKPIAKTTPSPSGKATGSRGTVAAKAGGQPAAEAPSGGIGHLTITTEPWARVLIGGVVVDEETPLLRHALPAGRHQVTVENPAAGLRKSLTIDVAAGAEVRRFVSLVE